MKELLSYALFFMFLVAGTKPLTERLKGEIEIWLIVGVGVEWGACYSSSRHGRHGSRSRRQLVT